MSLFLENVLFTFPRIVLLKKNFHVFILGECFVYFFKDFPVKEKLSCLYSFCLLFPGSPLQRETSL